ncbi:MAG: L-fucose mutarotase [Oscillospiraceae bacterium]|jgi:L-fucose mutarotase|nr:L-fucose mutarotase [Oscillospiraceae bacterium]
MLKGISPLIPPDLLKILAEMGHGDEIVIGDGNFPASSVGNRVVRCDGIGAPALLDAILALFPLDTYVDAPTAVMAVVPGDPIGDNPPIWNEYRAILDRRAPGTKIEQVERFAYYERGKKAYAVVQSGESALYANIILKKGVVAPQAGGV